MKNLRISTRLILAFGLLMLLALVLAAIGVWSLHETQAIDTEIAARTQLERTVTDWNHAVEARVNLLLGLAATSDAGRSTAFRRQIDLQTQKITSLEGTVSSHLESAEERSRLESADNLRKEYLTVVSDILEQSGGTADPASGEAAFEKLSTVGEHYLQSLNALSVFQRDQVAQAQVRSAKDAALSELVTALLARADLALYDAKRSGRDGVVGVQRGRLGS